MRTTVLCSVIALNHPGRGFPLRQPETRIARGWFIVSHPSEFAIRGTAVVARGWHVLYRGDSVDLEGRRSRSRVGQGPQGRARKKEPGCFILEAQFGRDRNGWITERARVGWYLAIRVKLRSRWTRRLKSSRDLGIESRDRGEIREAITASRNLKRGNVNESVCCRTVHVRWTCFNYWYFTNEILSYLEMCMNVFLGKYEVCLNWNGLIK